MIWSPSTSVPVASTARQRSASPSWAMPRSAPRAHDGGLEVVEVGRAVAVVDVEAVGLGADLEDLGAGQPEHLGRDLAGGAVGAVDDDLDAVEPVGQDGEQVGDVAGVAVGHRRRPGPTSAPVGRCQSWSQRGPRSRPRSGRRACARRAAKNLIPLSGMALCDAESITPKSAWVSAVRKAIAGVGQHAGVVDVDARRGQAGDHGGREELARGARVAPDDGLGAAPGSARRRHRGRGRPRR